MSLSSPQGSSAASATGAAAGGGGVAAGRAGGGLEGGGFDTDFDDLDDVFGTGFEELSDDDDEGTREEAVREMHAKVRLYCNDDLCDNLRDEYRSYLVIFTRFACVCPRVRTRSLSFILFLFFWSLL